MMGQMDGRERGEGAASFLPPEILRERSCGMGWRRILLPLPIAWANNVHNELQRTLTRHLAMVSILKRVSSHRPTAGRLQHADLESQNPQNFARASQEKGKSLALQSAESVGARGSGNKPVGRPKVGL